MADRVNSVAELIERTKGLPLEKMRFFINEDRREPKCFGIYQEPGSGRWIVYKNKADGSRAVRYSGPDEAYAAQEIWAKLNSEIALRKNLLADQAVVSREELKKKKRRAAIRTGGIIVLILGMLGYFVWTSRNDIRRGYYRKDNSLYYHQQDDWYYYDGGLWYPYLAMGTDDDWYADAEYYRDYPYADSYGSFEQSDYYVEDSDSSSDNDWGYDFDSWDSSDTDWDSDW